MKIDFTVHRPIKLKLGEASPKGAVYAPFTFAGNEANSARRYDEIAELTGMDVWNAHSAGTGKVYINSATRRSLKPGKLSEIAQCHAAEVATLLGGYTTLLGMGDSGRGVWVATMQQTESRPFSHVLIRDGANSYAPEPRLVAAKRLLQHGSDLGLAEPLPADKTQQTLKNRIFTTANALSEMATHASLMCAIDSEEAVLALARDRFTPLHYVGLGLGIGGTSASVQCLNERIARIRTTLPNLYDQVAPHLITYEPDWGHAALLNPIAAAQHIRATVALTQN